MDPNPIGTGTARAHNSRSSRLAGIVLRWVLPAVLLAALLWLLLRQFSLAELVSVVSGAQLGWILCGFLLYGLANILRAARMTRLLGWPYSRTVPLVPVMFVVSLFNNVLPMRSGELSFLYLMQGQGMEYGSSLGALVMSRIFDLLAVCSLFVWSVLTHSGVLAGSVAAPVLISAGAVAVLVGLLYALPSLAQGLARFCRAQQEKGAAVWSWLDALYRQADKVARSTEILRSQRVIGGAVVYSLLLWLVTYAWFDAFLRAIGGSMGFVPTVLGASFAAVSKALPIGSIGGFGAHEAGWALGFALLGQETGAAILSGFTVNVLTLLASALFGSLSLIGLALRSGRSIRSFWTSARRGDAG
jgi:glycosyltransferase 2 family protein